jgi:S1-C subfamily serine protease
MLRHALLICPLLAALLVVGAHAQQRKSPSNSAVDASQRNGAEIVFASAASKIVFLITRKSGELHARASGVILTADGYIATNYHALEGADAVEIRFFPDPQDLESYQSFNGAKILYANAERDIAVLKIRSKTLPFLVARPGYEPHVHVGETVYAVGNPQGLNNTITEATYVLAHRTCRRPLPRNSNDLNMPKDWFPLKVTLFPPQTG